MNKQQKDKLEEARQYAKQLKFRTQERRKKLERMRNR